MVSLLQCNSRLWLMDHMMSTGSVASSDSRSEPLFFKEAFSAVCLQVYVSDSERHVHL